MAAEESWADIPDNIIVCISEFLPCHADRVHMASVSRHWRAAVRGQGRPPPPLLPPLPALPPQLPWLIYPSTLPAPTFYSTLGRNFHRLHGLPFDVRAARCCGSGESGWLLLAFQAPHAHAYAFYNLNSGRRTPVPAGFRPPSPHNNAAVVPLHVKHASFPAAPPNSNGPNAVAAIAFVNGRPTAAFWCPGCPAWISAGGPLPLLGTPLDVMHHRGWFYFLLPGEQLIKIGATLHPNGVVRVLHRWDMVVRSRPGYIDDVTNFGPFGVMKHYLVVSRDRLLMAIRYVHNHGRGTASIGVSQLGTYPTTTAGIDDRVWENASVLDGRVLFLGPGCSRCFELAPYNAFRGIVADDGATIYFLDKRTFPVPAAVVDDDGEQNAAADDMGGVDNDQPDMGRFSQGDRKTEHWPQGAPGCDVPPTWWLH